MKMPEKIKWIAYDDDYINQKIYAIDGFQYGNLNDIYARIFAQRIKLDRWDNKSWQTRYFPQIDVERPGQLETVIIIGDMDKGYKYIKEAKMVLVEELEKVLKKIA
jgi:hypothetical protein